MRVPGAGSSYCMLSASLMRITPCFAVTPEVPRACIQEQLASTREVLLAEARLQLHACRQQTVADVLQVDALASAAIMCAAAAALRHQALACAVPFCTVVAISVAQTRGICGQASG
jgi:predicted DNA repair protein MutK